MNFRFSAKVGWPKPMNAFLKIALMTLSLFCECFYPFFPLERLMSYKGAFRAMNLSMLRRNWNSGLIEEWWTFPVPDNKSLCFVSRSAATCAGAPESAAPVGAITQLGTLLWKPLPYTSGQLLGSTKIQEAIPVKAICTQEIRSRIFFPYPDFS